MERRAPARLGRTSRGSAPQLVGTLSSLPHLIIWAMQKASDLCLLFPQV